MSAVVENIESPSPRQQFVHECSRLPRLERNAIAVVSTAMISALLVTAVAAQQTQPNQQAPTTATVPASPELAPEIASWQQAVVARLARFQRYPAQAKGATGIVKLSFSIDRQGHVLNSQIIKSSGSAVLDAEAHPCSHVPRHCRPRRPRFPIAISLSYFQSVSDSGDTSVTRLVLKPPRQLLGQRQPLGPSGLNHGPAGLSARPEGPRAGRPSLGT